MERHFTKHSFENSEKKSGAQRPLVNVSVPLLNTEKNMISYRLGTASLLTSLNLSVSLNLKKKSLPLDSPCSGRPLKKLSVSWKVIHQKSIRRHLFESASWHF